MEKYHDRHHAGRMLARELIPYSSSDCIILALPRGGVPVGYEIAKALKVPLEVFVVRKLGVPGASELAFGAIASGDITVLNQDIIADYQLTQADMDEVIAKEKQELQRREVVYRNSPVMPDLKDKTIILVDDGIATGATVKAAIRALYQFKPARIILAIPVAEPDTVQVLSALVSAVICPMQPAPLNAVGLWYDDFTQTEDQDVFRLLKALQQQK